MVLTLAALLISGCDGTPATRLTAPNAQATAAAGATIAAQAAESAAPVILDVGVTVQGNAEQHTVVFVSTVTVHNHNPFAISLAGDCSDPPILRSYTNPATGFSMPEVTPVCPNAPTVDLNPSIAAGGAHTWTLIDNYRGETEFVAGVYTVKVTVHLWHSGTLAQLEADASTPYGSASVTTTVTVP